jgi:hypothetical protein
MSKLQSKTWRQWDESTWVCLNRELFLILTSKRENDIIKYSVILSNSTEFYGNYNCCNHFDEMQQALDFIKEFIADE